MSRLAFNGDGGKTDEYGTLLVQQRLFKGEVAEGCKVVANASPSMSVRVQAGTMRLPTGTAPANFWYEAAIDTANPGEAVTISTANVANPRRGFVVAYIDKVVVRTTSVTNNSNNVLKLAAVPGTAASSPSDPTTSQITAVVGASNPYIILGRITVGTGVTQITNSDITDQRNFMGVNRSSPAVGSYTNPGSGGGTFFFTDFGGIKMLWGATANIATGSSGDVTYPTGFFSTIQLAAPSLQQVSGTNALNAPYLSSSSASGATVNLIATAGSGSMPVQLFVIGS